MSQSFDRLRDAEHLLVEAEADPNKAAGAARAALRSLLDAWSVQPEGTTVAALLDQAAQTDESLHDFRPDAVVLDGLEPQPDAAKRAKIFVDAARARLANI